MAEQKVPCGCGCVPQKQTCGCECGSHKHKKVEPTAPNMTEKTAAEKTKQ
jgi:hypothetical protein